jgi:NAD(P)-dependent dehydrogenase (short-subunit alcohol dehydrogenase family)
VPGTTAAASAPPNTFVRALPDRTSSYRALDLGFLSSIAAFASSLPADAIDRLVLNAGVMTTQRRTTQDGFELMFGTNALGHHALVARLWERLLAARGARVITQSSESHRHGRLNLDDLQGEHAFSPVGAYNASKLAQHVLAVELGRRTQKVQSVVAQPGWVASQLGREIYAGNGPLAQRLAVRVGDRLVGQTPEQGARAALRATIDEQVPDASSGRYFTPSRLRRLRGAPHIADADPRVLDLTLGQTLWAAVVALTDLEPGHP